VFDLFIYYLYVLYIYVHVYIIRWTSWAATLHDYFLIENSANCVYPADMRQRDMTICVCATSHDVRIVWPRLKARSLMHLCCGKAVNIAYSECVSAALVILHAMRVRHIVFHVWVVWLYHICPHYLIKRCDFRGPGGGGVIQHKIVFWVTLQRLSETFFILRRTDLLCNVNQQNALFKLML